MKLFWTISGVLFLLLSFLLIWTVDVEEQNQQAATIKDNPALAFQKIVLVDTFKNELVREQATKITTAKYYPIYLDEWKDEIYLTYNTSTIPTKKKDKSYPAIQADDILIWVDTTRIIGSGHLSLMAPPPHPKMVDRVKWFLQPYRGKVASHPVFIFNKSDNVLPIAYSRHLNLILQALDSTGLWKPIQQSYVSKQDKEVLFSQLLPQNIAIASCPLFEGNYDTQLRLCFNKNSSPIYSNTFRGSINYSQFEER